MKDHNVPWYPPLEVGDKFKTLGWEVTDVGCTCVRCHGIVLTPREAEALVKAFGTERPASRRVAPSVGTTYLAEVNGEVVRIKILGVA